MSKHCNSVNIDHIITLIVLNKNLEIHLGKNRMKMLMFFPWSFCLDQKSASVLSGMIFTEICSASLIVLELTNLLYST